MKRLACILIIFTLICSVSYAASNIDSPYANAIILAKSKIDIPDEFSEFSSSADTVGKITSYSLSWSTKSDDQKSISVDINQFGDITTYNLWDSTLYSYSSGISNFSSLEIARLAKKWIYKVNPSFADQLDFNAEADLSSIYSSAVNISFKRIINNIDFCGDFVDISLNKYTGDIIRMYAKWTYSDNIPNTDAVISVDEVRSAFTEKSGLTLSYMKNSNSKDAVLVYSPLDTSFKIDAITGNTPSLDETYSDENYSVPETPSENNPLIPQQNNDLTEQELLEIQKYNSFIKEKDAENIIKSLKNTNLETFKVIGSGYRKNKLETSYILNVSLENEKTSERAQATLDATTGKLISLYILENNSDKKTIKNNLENYANEFASIYAASEISSSNLFSSKDSVFKFCQYINDIPYEGNNITIAVSPYTGRIISFVKTWENDINFENPVSVLTNENASALFFDKIGFVLKYTNMYKKYYDEPTVKLVYELNDFSHLISAKSGALLNSDLSEYRPKNTKFVLPQDIDGHYSQPQIEQLIINGIFNFKSQYAMFRPDDYITQQEVLSFITTISKGYVPFSTSIDTLYADNTDIIDTDEKNPTSFVTRENASKYMIRALGHKDIATLDGIFNCGFADRWDITRGLEGYVALAKGLKIISGDENNDFKPLEYTTRADFAIMLYNALVKK